MRDIALATVVLWLTSISVFAQDAATMPAPVADPAPDATVRLTAGSIAAGIGYVWGHGEVVYLGKVHRFRISGISVEDIGVAHLSAFGAVYHLKDLSNLNGDYIAASEGLALGSGTSGYYLKNDSGVVVKLLAATKGLRFNLGADGMRIELDE
jgi:hypothetical protein